jgi:membrane carboxypeptidase/penicillin-binding protein
MDVKAQNAARKNISEHISEKNQNALLLAGIQPGTGRVRVLAANRKFKLDDPDNPQNKLSSDPRKAAKKIRGTYPNTTNPLLTGGGDITGYQAGSVFKMFTMVAALENGYPLAYSINAPAKYISKYIIGPGRSTCNGKYYCPSNSGGKAGGVTNMWTGFGKSVNTFFVPLAERVGAEKVVDVAKRFGVQFRAKTDADLAATEASAHQWGAFTLGVSSSTPLDMANAYATLAGDGMYCTPTPVQQITSHSGEKIDVGKPHCTRATSADVARAALDAARCPVGDSAQLGSCNGATARQAYQTIRHPIYGKSGTTDHDKTASLIIGSTSLTVAGYLVNPDYQDHSDRLSHDIVNPAVWDTMDDYLKGKPKVEFKKPSSTKISIGDQRSIPDVTCATIEGAKARVEGAGFSASVGAEVESNCPKGTAAGTNPSGRTIKGGYVSIEISKGKADEPADPTKPAGPRPPGRR